MKALTGVVRGEGLKAQLSLVCGEALKSELSSDPHFFEERIHDF